MDIVWDLLKSALTLGFLFFILLAIAVLFIVVFKVATDIDDRMQI